ncbi:hypothetical protein KAR91_17115 [Candidatus Pacearchaeota archaeon]|nr:hypothetical protein [Candidatus Pacearchaeota archaeon]
MAQKGATKPTWAQNQGVLIRDNNKNLYLLPVRYKDNFIMLNNAGMTKQISKEYGEYEMDEYNLEDVKVIVEEP